MYHGAVGASLLASGIGFIPGIVLEAVTIAASLLDVAGIAILRHCSAKAEKHRAVHVLTTSKLDTAHSHI